MESRAITTTLVSPLERMLVDADEGLAARLTAALSPHYEVRESLGSGGFGSVFRAIHGETGQSVAVKVLRTQTGWTPAAVAAQVARFEREATLCAALHHPNIVRLLDKGHVGDLYYAIYELVPGETLRSLLDREARLSIERTAELMSQVLAAIATAHAAGVVHRDLKPANIMVSTAGFQTRVKVLDFGISTLTLEARDTAFHNVTRSHELIGTPQYCAPEQLRGETPTPRTDIYAWGLVFLECITGQRAIPGSTLAEIYHHHLSALEIPLPSSLVGHPLGDFLRRVLRKNPAQRAADAAALDGELQRLPLGNLVGALQLDVSVQSTMSHDGPKFGTAQALIERRQVTVIGVTLRIVPVGERVDDLEALDPLLRDQLGLLRDSLVRYGGAVTGELADTFMVMFGYPTASDADARRAVRTVLEALEDVRRRSDRLTATHALALELRVGVHAGLVTVFQGQAPSGITPTRALALAAAAPANAVVVSADSRRLFEPFAVLESSGAVAVSGEGRPIPTALLLGERRGEALAFKPGQSVAQAFIGRRAELAQIEEHLAAADAAGQVHGALIVGEAGIGKSRLIREVLARARAAGRAVIECRCLTEHRNVALWPVLPVLRDQLGLSGVGDAAAAALLVEALARFDLPAARFVPILSVWLAIPLPEGFEPAQVAPFRQRELLLEALVAILARPSAATGPLLLFEDLHWADPTTLDLLRRLLAAESASPPYLLCTARPELVAPWPARLLRVGLDRLTADDAASLALHVWGAGERRLPPDVLAAIVARADGIPLFIEEVTRMVMESGQIDVKAIPITLRDSLSGRLDQLGEARQVVQIAAALGREFDGALLLEVASGDELGVHTAVERLIDARLIYRRRWVSGSTYVFRHALIQEAAYDSMPRELRRQVHARVVDVLRQQFAGTSHATPVVLARHHAGAGQFAEAVRLGTEAAQLSVDKSSNVEALAEADQVSAWLPELPEPLRADAELRLNGVKLQATMSMQGWASRNVHALAEASRPLLARCSETRDAVAILSGLFLYYNVSSQHAAGRRVADELVALADRVGDSSLKAVAATAKGANFNSDGQVAAAEPWLEQALAHYDPTRDQKQGSLFGLDSRVWSGALLALVEWGIGRTQRALRLVEDAIAWAREIKHVPSLGIALLYASQIHQMAGDRARVRLRTGELLEWSKTYGLPALEGYGAILACWADADLPGATRIIARLKELNCNLKITYYGSLLVDLEEQAEHWPEAIAQVEAWLRDSATFADHSFSAELMRRRAVYEMRLPAPDVDVARRSLDDARRLARQQGMFRFEAAAIRAHEQLFGGSAELRARLAEIHGLIPDLIPTPGAP